MSTQSTAEPPVLRGQDLYRRAKQRIPGGTQLLSKRPEMFLPEGWPAYYEWARGAEVQDLDGRRYIDMAHNSVGACPLGYADSEVDASVRRAIDQGTMSTLNCPEEVELAELLCELHPWADQLRYTRSGGESMAMAVRIARAATGRDVVAFCGYHGWHDWYLAANLDNDVLGGAGLLLPGLSPVGVPRGLRGTARTFHFNRLDELRAIVAECGADLAAVICEPQRDEKPASGFLEGLRDIARASGAVLLFDEITSGFRLHPGGVHRLYGVDPDLCVLGKGIGNGYAIGCVIGRAEVMEAAQSTFISSTYWTERIGPTAALATIRKFCALEAHRLLIAAGQRVQEIWKQAAAQAGLRVAVGPEDMPPLSHMSFRYDNARAVQTLWCQALLDRGYLDNGAFYATCAHTPEILERYQEAAFAAADQVARAVEGGRVEHELRGPVGHRGFARLTGAGDP